MGIDIKILSDTPNGLDTRSVWALLKNGAEVRKIELVLGNEEDARQALKKPSHLWDQAEELENGAREWRRAKQGESRATFDTLIFILSDRLSSGDDLARVLRDVEQALGDDPEQKAAWVTWNQALHNASEGHIRQLMAVLLMIVLGRLDDQ
jgi:hypothetical protein